jgi:hypothetical protein
VVPHPSRLRGRGGPRAGNGRSRPARGERRSLRGPPGGLRPGHGGARPGIPAEALEELADHFWPRLRLPWSSGPAWRPAPERHRGEPRGAGAERGVRRVGQTVRFSGRWGGPRPPSPTLPRRDREMAGGGVGAVVIRGTNPAYTLPPPRASRGLGQVGFKVVITPQMNETAALADLVLPERHSSSAGGIRTRVPDSGRSSSRPCGRCRTSIPAPAGDILLGWPGPRGQDLGAETFHDYLRNRWSERHAAAGIAGRHLLGVLARGAPHRCGGDGGRGGAGRGDAAGAGPGPRFDARPSTATRTGSPARSIRRPGSPTAAARTGPGSRSCRTRSPRSPGIPGWRCTRTPPGTGTSGRATSCGDLAPR